MLHLSSGVALGVDVGDFLALERGLHGQRIFDPAAEHQEIGRLAEALRHLGTTLCPGDSPFNQGWRRQQLFQVDGQVVIGQSALSVPDPAGQQVERGQRANEGLGRGDAHLRAASHDDRRIGLPSCL